MDAKQKKNYLPKAAKPKYAGSIRKYYKKREEKEVEWYFLCGCGKKGVNYYDYRPCIQCDVCKVWKHVKCVNFSEDVTKLSNQMRKRRVWVCSDCKSGNFKFIAKIWLKEELLDTQIDRVKKQIRSISSSDDYTKSNREIEEFERNLAKKKSERNKILIRKPTAFDEEYENVDQDQYEYSDNADSDDSDELESKIENDFVKIEELTNSHKNVKSNSNLKSSKPPLISYKSYLYKPSMQKNNEKDEIEIDKENANNIEDEKKITGKILFIDEIVNISPQNSASEPHHMNENLIKSILKSPTSKFDEGPSLSSICEYRNDPDNSVFKEKFVFSLFVLLSVYLINIFFNSSKQRIVRAGRNLIRTLTVY